MIFDEIEPAWQGSTDYYTSRTNGYAAEKTAFRVVSDSQINPTIFFHKKLPEISSSFYISHGTQQQGHLPYLL